MLKPSDYAYVGRSLTIWERFWLRISPARRAEYEREQKAIIRELVRNPDIHVYFK